MTHPIRGVIHSVQCCPNVMRIVSNPSKLPCAWRERDRRRAELFADFLPSESGILVEIGCGSDQLTVPLSKFATGYIIEAVDRFAGPYTKDYELLLRDYNKADY